MDLYERITFNAVKTLFNDAVLSDDREKLLSKIIAGTSLDPSDSTSSNCASHAIYELFRDLPPGFREEYKKNILERLIKETYEYSPDAKEQIAFWNAKLPLLPCEEESERQIEARKIITQAGGIFIGKNELIRLGSDGLRRYQIPEIPEKFNRAFLEAPHPLREGSIGSHIILGYNTTSEKWYAIDRGNGGESDLIPGSLNKTFSQQKSLLKHNGRSIKIGKTRLRPFGSSSLHWEERVLENATRLQLLEGKLKETTPFHGVQGRTNVYSENDISIFALATKCTFGYPSIKYSKKEDYISVTYRKRRRYLSNFRFSNVGLIAGWY